MDSTCATGSATSGSCRFCFGAEVCRLFVVSQPLSLNLLCSNHLSFQYPAVTLRLFSHRLKTLLFHQAFGQDLIMLSQLLMIVLISLSLALSCKCLCNFFYLWHYILLKMFITLFPLPFYGASFYEIDPVCLNRPFCLLVLWYCWLAYVAYKNRPKNDLDRKLNPALFSHVRMHVISLHTELSCPHLFLKVSGVCMCSVVTVILCGLLISTVMFTVTSYLYSVSNLSVTLSFCLFQHFFVVT